MSSPLFMQQARSPSGTGRAVYPAPSDRHALPANEYFEPKSEQTMPAVDREPDQRAAETESNDKTILTGSYGAVDEPQAGGWSGTATWGTGPGSGSKSSVVVVVAAPCACTMRSRRTSRAASTQISKARNSVEAIA